MQALINALCAHFAPAPTTPPRRILVAAVLNPREVALNIGTAAGVQLGTRFELLDDGLPIIFEGEHLGLYERSPVTVEVIEAQERLVVARLPWRPSLQPLWMYDRPKKTPVLPDWVAIGSRARVLPL